MVRHSLSAKIETLQRPVKCGHTRRHKAFKNISSVVVYFEFDHINIFSTFELKNGETKLKLNDRKTYLKTNPCLASVLKIVF